MSNKQLRKDLEDLQEIITLHLSILSKRYKDSLFLRNMSLHLRGEMQMALQALAEAEKEEQECEAR